MIRRINRKFSHRFPLYGENHEGMGKIALISGSVVMILAGLVSMNKWRKTEISKRSIEKYQAVDPNNIVPFTDDLNPINVQKLIKAVNEGGDKFIQEELIDRLLSSPEEFIYINTASATPKDREKYLSFIRKNLSQLS